MTFSETDLLLRAAIDGLGIALSRRILAQPELDAGRLVRHSVRADRSYFIVHPATVEPPPRLLIVRDWLLEQARTTTEGTHHASRKTA
jgi:LysR family glycine cleavage system transcriptional activator